MSNKMPWFRAYTEMIDDEKLRLLAFEDRWHFIALLCLKGQGVLDEGGNLLMRKAAVKMGLDVRSLEEVARRLAEVGLIDKDTLQPIAWSTRQHQSDSSAERTRRYRERKYQEKQQVAGCDADVTSPTRHSDALDTDTDTDTEVEKEKEKKEKAGRANRATHPQKPSDVGEQVWKDWLQLRKDKRASVTQTVLDGARREADKAGLTLEAFLRKWCERGSQGLQAEWLRERTPQVASAHGGLLNRQEALEARNRAVAAEWVKEMEAKHAAG